MQQFGLIGKKLGHSFSKRYFNEKFAREGLDAHYELFELASIAELPALMQETPGLRGLNVTIPYKKEVPPFLDELSPEAAAVGAVNTILLTQSGKKVGYNTDIFGFQESLEDFLQEERPDKAIILGTGGAAQAVKYVLDQLGISEQLSISRNPQQPGEASYEALKQESVEAYPLIINTTPLGMYPQVEQAPDFPYDQLQPHHRVVDLIYNPETTRFMELAASRGARTLNGMPMLIGQAEKAWEIWQQPM
ncbi:MAG: shikimate dehydrogenase [Bacteroidota bacterium]